MDYHLHDTKSCYSKVLQIEHGLEPQDVITGDGRGQYNIIDGRLIIYSTVHELIKLDNVWRVIVGENYFMITVIEPRRWKAIEGIIVGIVARHLPDDQ